MNRIPAVLPATCLLLASVPVVAADFELRLRYQTETSDGSGRFHRLERLETWKPEETAIIVCDMWDYHHCLNAVRRLEQFAPRLDRVLQTARASGITIIHSPSSCMDAYAEHGARLRAIDTPKSPPPPDITSWCSRIPSEERAVYPIDQSDGGEDDDPEEHAQWAAKLESMGRDPGSPWKKQSSLITIDEGRDYISDRGDEVWNILQHLKIENVILTGVHTNMCVLGRPFGLRQMVRNKINTVLMRDMTDTMYNPLRWPYVSHFTGTDLIIEHIERFVCPTISSDQMIGGKEYRFPNDQRPHLAVLVAEDEYETERTLPPFAVAQLGKQFRVSYVFGSDQHRNQIPGLEVLKEADVLLISVRRRVLRPESMKLVREFVMAGKPVVGIRTASHAFSLRGKKTPEGYVAWPEFDAQVFGGNYTNHHGNSLRSTVHVEPHAKGHTILEGLEQSSFPQGGSLYVTSPLAGGTQILATGRVDGHPEEPVAWTFRRADGGKSFYTSLGHPADFENPSFRHLLTNAICWAAGIKPKPKEPLASRIADPLERWTLVNVPHRPEQLPPAKLEDVNQQAAWYRCAVRLPPNSRSEKEASLCVKGQPGHFQAWMNGRELRWTFDSQRKLQFKIPSDVVEPDVANLLVVRLDREHHGGRLSTAPVLNTHQAELTLSGRWQFRYGANAAWSNLPLPAIFGTSTDIFFDASLPTRNLDQPQVDSVVRGD